MLLFLSMLLVTPESESDSGYGDSVGHMSGGVCSSGEIQNGVDVSEVQMVCVTASQFVQCCTS